MANKYNKNLTSAVNTVEEVADAIIRNHGNLSATARELQLTRQALQSRVRSHPELQETLENARDAFIDEAEKTLYEHVVDKKSLSATMFTLRTIGKTRGWGETPLVVNQNANMNIDMKKLESMPLEERQKLDELLSKLLPDEDPE